MGHAYGNCVSWVGFPYVVEGQKVCCEEKQILTNIVDNEMVEVLPYLTVGMLEETNLM